MSGPEESDLDREGVQGLAQTAPVSEATARGSRISISDSPGKIAEGRQWPQEQYSV
jgi:hypothetical protein